MRKIFVLFFLCLAILTTAHAQIPPNAFNYSAVARNAAGDPIAISTIGIQITILKTSPTGASQYMENHFVNTDAFGLFNLVIGAGAVQSGNMATIDWSNDNYYLKVGMDATGGSSFVTMGTTQLLSVPYALYAKSAGIVSGGTGITIESVSPTGDTLFLSNGQTFVAGGISGGGSGNLVLPTVTTSVTDITSNSARFGGVISNATDNLITERGFVYSYSPNPRVDFGIRLYSGTGIGEFQTNSDSLRPLLSSNYMYYVRAYAITENNITVYGNEVNFTTLPTGQTGPGGGIVFFDKGNADGGWQYLEAAPSDQSSGIVWGCNETAISWTQFSVGSGEANTALIVAGCNETTFAAKLCADLNLGGQNDWFLPSLYEMRLLHRNLYLNGVGNLDSSTNYWSSSEHDGFAGYTAWYFNFNYADWLVEPKSTAYNVRAIRAF